MDIRETYFLLFIDNLIANLIICPQEEFVFDSLRVFNMHNELMMLIITTTSGLCAIIINYFFGRIIYKIWVNVEEQGVSAVRNSRREKIKIFLQKYYMLLLLISLWPFGGKFVQLIAGMYRFNLFWVVLICLGCKIAYYGTLLIIS